MAKYYRDRGWLVELATSISQAHELVVDGDWSPHVILANLGFSDGKILDHLEELQSNIKFSEWIFIVDEADATDLDKVEELAYDFLQKPFEQKRLDILVGRAQRAARCNQRLESFSSLSKKKYQIDAYLGNSEPVQKLKSMLADLTKIEISAMIISGETGTGKGLVARILHYASDLRKDGPLVEMNCAGLPKELMESEMFGHEAGAFTGAKSRHRGYMEQADGGTLFMDEIGDMPMDLQAKLLKAIEDKKIRRVGGERELNLDVQIITASGIDLKEAIEKGGFRSDLYHRLAVFCLALPPLRTRKSDLVELVPSIIAEFNSKANKRVKVISDEIWKDLLDYDWPGNIRELRNVIERCVLLSTDENLPGQWLQLKNSCSPTPETLVKESSSEEASCPINDNSRVTIPLDGSMSLEEMDKHIIRTALEQNSFNVMETARSLGTTRETLRYRIQKYDLKNGR
ncbi:MAG: sigma-54-dependent Fis family transcriptional regulator [Nitrospinaceae bacterium]|nr:MAG: sigma-54-dependent Fis family transcriptional regulator [Nitrospinaceae bacterium]